MNARSDMLEKVISGMRPLLWIDECLLLSRGYELWCSDSRLSQLRFIARLPCPGLLRLASKGRYLARVLRTGLQTAQRLDDRRVLVVARDMIWCVDIVNGRVELDFVIPEGRRLLFLSRLKDEKGVDASIVFGEYFDNPDRLPVRIWRRGIGHVAIWDIAHVFPAGEINHVHNICSGVDGRVWVLTGDFGHSAAIWRGDCSLRFVERELSGRQSFRGTWICESPSGALLWATDTQLERNHVICATRQAGGWSVVAIHSIEGSCIYWQRTARGVVFSTSVEPGEPSGRRLYDIFDRTPGDGIIGRSAVLYHYDQSSGLSEVARAEKDCLPLRLAQFGCYVLPAGIGPSSAVVCSGQSLSKIDGKTLLYRLPLDL